MFISIWARVPELSRFFQRGLRQGLVGFQTDLHVDL